MRPHFTEHMHDPTYFIGMLASLLTGVSATFATFYASLPDRSRYWLLLPAPAVALWIANLGYQCVADWMSLPPGAVTIGAATSCVVTLTLTSLPLSLTLLGMLRYVSLLQPMAIALTGSLAVSALTASALTMFHPLDATVMVLGWNLGTTMLFLGIATVLGHARRRRALRTEE